MITLRSILVAHDFSTSGQAAFQHGCALAAAFDASLHLLHVVSAPLQETWAGYTPGAEFIGMIERLQADARKHLEALLPRADITAGRVIVATAWGDPVDEILNYAREHGIGLIVCGTHGRRGWDRVMMSSVAERVVRLASCPVLTLHCTGSESSVEPRQDQAICDPTCSSEGE